MVRNLDLKSLNRVAPVAAALAGAAVALLVAIVPSWRLEAVVNATGLASHFAAAQPPLGATARSALALVSGGGVAVAVWGALMLVARYVDHRVVAVAEPDAPILRRADAHPDAPARRPLRASEDLGFRASEEPAMLLRRDVAPALGQPLPLGPVESPAHVPSAGDRISVREVPVDLDTPLAAVDPAAIPDVPREPVRPVAPLAKTVVEERIETFELTPIRRAPATARPAGPSPRPASGSTSLAALLDRLEQGSTRRATRPAPPLSETLGMLRGLAPREV